MRNFKYGVLAGTAALALVAFAPSAANATAYSYSALVVSGLTFSGPAFAAFDFTSDTSASLSPGGAAVPGHANCNTSGCTIDAPQAFFGVGAGAGANPGQNQFGQVGKVDSYARADSIILSSKIQGGNEGQLAQVAETAVGSTGQGQAQSGVTKQDWSFLFSATSNGTVTVNFHAKLVLAIDLSDPGVQAGTAASKVQINQKGLTSGATPFQVENFDTGANALTRSIGGPAIFVDPLSQFAIIEGDYAATFTVNAGQAYQLEITTQNNTDVTNVAVPEPATLGLLGLGLLGVGYGVRRRKAA